MRTIFNVLWVVVAVLMAATPVLAGIPSTTVEGIEVFLHFDFQKALDNLEKNELPDSEILELAVKNNGEPIDFVVVLAQGVSVAEANDLLERQVAFGNAAFHNDGIPYRLRQLGDVVTNFVIPTTDHVSDLTTSCLKGQEIRAPRGADFLVFIKKNSASMAFRANGSPQNACVLVTVGAGDRTLAHEFAHMAVGALHDMQATLHEEGSERHGHFFCEEMENAEGFFITHRTIMATSICGSGDTVSIASFSDPNKQMEGNPLGVPGESNLVKVLREELGAIAAFDSSNVEECVASDNTLCLGDRFKVTAQWWTSTSTGPAKGATNITPDTGTFYYFSKNNIELIVKVLNGCSENGHYWVWANGLTAQPTEVTVKDTLTGEEQTYHHPGGPFTLIDDLHAFACQ